MDTHSLYARILEMTGSPALSCKSKLNGRTIHPLSSDEQFQILLSSLFWSLFKSSRIKKCKHCHFSNRVCGCLWLSPAWFHSSVSVYAASIDNILHSAALFFTDVLHLWLPTVSAFLNHAKKMSFTASQLCSLTPLFHVPRFLFQEH